MVIDRIGSSPTKRAEVTAEAPKQTAGATGSAASKNDRAERLTERDEIRLSDETRERTDDVKGPGKDENRKPEDKEREEMKRELEEIKSLLAGLVESFQANEAAAEEGAGARAEASPVEGGMAEAAPAQQAQQASPLDNQLFQMILRLLSQLGIGLPQNGQMGGQFGQMGGQFIQMGGPFGQRNGNAHFGQGFPQQMNTSPNFGGIKNDLDVKTKMSGEKLYEIMSTITDPIAQAAFYNQAMGSGRGMNNLSEVVRDKKFGGDQVKMNQWINLHGSGGWAGEPFKSEQYGPASMGRWNFATGEWVGGIAGERTYKIANWNSMA